MEVMQSPAFVFPENTILGETAAFRVTTPTVNNRRVQSRDSAREVSSLHDFLMEQSNLIKQKSRKSQITRETEDVTNHSGTGTPDGSRTDITEDDQNSLILASTCHDEGNKIEEDGVFEKAIKYHLKALEIRRQVLGDDHVFTAISSARVAYVYGKMGERYFDKALELYNEALPIILNQNQADVEAKAKAKAQNDEKEIDPAAEVEKALEKNEASVVPATPSSTSERLTAVFSGNLHGVISAIHAHIGSIHFHRQEYDDSLYHYTTALSNMKEQFKTTSKSADRSRYNKTRIEIASIYNVLGTLYGKSSAEDPTYKKLSLSKYKKCLAIREKLLGKKHPDTLTTYNNIGSIYFHDDDYNSAMKYYKRGLPQKIGERKNTIQASRILLSKQSSVYDHGFDQVLSKTFSNIGSVYFKKKSYRKAVEYYSESLRLQHIGNKDSRAWLSLATTYSNIASAKSKLGDVNNALDFHEKAANIRENELGDHLDTAVSYYNAGHAFSLSQDYEGALDAYQRSLRIRKKLLEEYNEDVAASYSGVAKSLYFLQQYDESIENYKHAIKIEEKLFGKKHLTTGMTYNNLATAYYSSNDFDKALEFYGKALAVKLKKFGAQHKDLYSVYSNIGAAYWKSSKKDDSALWFQKACEVDRDRFEQDHSISPEGELMIMRGLSGDDQIVAEDPHHEVWSTNRNETESAYSQISIPEMKNILEGNNKASHDGDVYRISVDANERGGDDVSVNSFENDAGVARIGVSPLFPQDDTEDINDDNFGDDKMAEKILESKSTEEIRHHDDAIISGVVKRDGSQNETLPTQSEDDHMIEAASSSDKELKSEGNGNFFLSALATARKAMSTKDQVESTESSDQISDQHVHKEIDIPINTNPSLSSQSMDENAALTPSSSFEKDQIFEDRNLECIELPVTDLIGPSEEDNVIEEQTPPLFESIAETLSSPENDLSTLDQSSPIEPLVAAGTGMNVLNKNEAAVQERDNLQARELPINSESDIIVDDREKNKYEEHFYMVGDDLESPPNNDEALFATKVQESVTNTSADVDDDKLDRSQVKLEEDVTTSQENNQQAQYEDDIEFPIYVGIFEHLQFVSSDSSYNSGQNHNISESTQESQSFDGNVAVNDQQNLISNTNIPYMADHAQTDSDIEEKIDYSAFVNYPTNEHHASTLKDIRDAEEVNFDELQVEHEVVDENHFNVITSQDRHEENAPYNIHYLNFPIYEGIFNHLNFVSADTTYKTEQTSDSHLHAPPMPSGDSFGVDETTYNDGEEQGVGADTDDVARGIQVSDQSSLLMQGEDLSDPLPRKEREMRLSLNIDKDSFVLPALDEVSVMSEQEEIAQNIQEMEGMGKDCKEKVALGLPVYEVVLDTLGFMDDTNGDFSENPVILEESRSEVQDSFGTIEKSLDVKETEEIETGNEALPLLEATRTLDFPVYEDVFETLKFENHEIILQESLIELEERVEEDIGEEEGEMVKEEGDANSNSKMSPLVMAAGAGSLFISNDKPLDDDALSQAEDLVSQKEDESLDFVAKEEQLKVEEKEQSLRLQAEKAEALGNEILETEKLMESEDIRIENEMNIEEEHTSQAQKAMALAEEITENDYSIQEEESNIQEALEESRLLQSEKAAALADEVLESEQMTEEELVQIQKDKEASADNREMQDRNAIILAEEADHIDRDTHGSILSSIEEMDGKDIQENTVLRNEVAAVSTSILPSEDTDNEVGDDDIGITHIDDHGKEGDLITDKSPELDPQTETEVEDPLEKTAAVVESSESEEKDKSPELDLQTETEVEDPLEKTAAVVESSEPEEKDESPELDLQAETPKDANDSGDQDVLAENDVEVTNQTTETAQQKGFFSAFKNMFSSTNQPEVTDSQRSTSKNELEGEGQDSNEAEEQVQSNTLKEKNDAPGDDNLNNIPSSSEKTPNGPMITVDEDLMTPISPITDAKSNGRSPEFPSRFDHAEYIGYSGETEDYDALVTLGSNGLPLSEKLPVSKEVEEALESNSRSTISGLSAEDKMYGLFAEESRTSFDNAHSTRPTTPSQRWKSKVSRLSLSSGSSPFYFTSDGDPVFDRLKKHMTRNYQLNQRGKYMPKKKSRSEKRFGYNRSRSPRYVPQRKTRVNAPVHIQLYELSRERRKEGRKRRNMIEEDLYKKEITRFISYAHVPSAPQRRLLRSREKIHNSRRHLEEEFAKPHKISQVQADELYSRLVSQKERAKQRMEQLRLQREKREEEWIKQRYDQKVSLANASEMYTRLVNQRENAIEKKIIEKQVKEFTEFEEQQKRFQHPVPLKHFVDLNKKHTVASSLMKFDKEE